MGDPIPGLEDGGGIKGNLYGICSSVRLAPALESGTGGSELGLGSVHIDYALNFDSTLDHSEVVDHSNNDFLGGNLPPTRAHSSPGPGGFPIFEDRFWPSFLNQPSFVPEHDSDGNQLQQPPVIFLENVVAQTNLTPDTFPSNLDIDMEVLLVGNIQSSSSPQTPSFSNPTRTTLSPLPSAILSLPPQSNPSPQSTGTSGLQSTVDRFPCPISNCNKSFKRSYDVKRHQLSHSARKFGCQFGVCKRSGQNGFFRKDHLEQHLRLSHGKMKLKWKWEKSESEMAGLL